MARFEDLIRRALDRKGEPGAAVLLHKVGEQGAVARDLAYRLYTTCEDFLYFVLP